MAAITWRNVSGPTGAAELNALAGASRQIGGAFEGLQNALVNYQKEEGRQFEQRKTDNTNQFLNALHSQFRTPEELDAAIKSGAVGALQSQFGNDINHEQVRGAADQLLATRRDQVRAGNEYSDDTRRRGERDVIDNIRSMAQQGQFDEAIANVNTNDLINNAAELEYINNLITAKDDKDYKRGQDAERNKLGWANARASQTQADASMRNSNAYWKQLDAELKSNVGIEGALTKQLENTVLNQGALGDKDANEKMIKGLTELGFKKNQIEDTIYNINKYYGNGIDIGDGQKLNLPIATIMEAAALSSDNPLALGWSRRGDDLVNTIDSFLKPNSSLYKKGLIENIANAQGLKEYATGNTQAAALLASRAAAEAREQQRIAEPVGVLGRSMR